MRKNVCQNSPVYHLGVDCEDYYRKSKLRHKLRKLHREFDLVLIVELLQESLILLKNLLHMDWTDIIQFKLNESTNKEPLSAEAEKNLKDMMAPDVELYDYFYQQLQTKIKLKRRSIDKGIKMLNVTMARVARSCPLKDVPYLNMPHVTSKRLTNGKNNELCVHVEGNYDYVKYMLKKYGIKRK